MADDDPETLTPLSVLGALGERFEANTKAQLELATAVSRQTETISKASKRTWLIAGLVILSVLSIASTVIMALVLADVDQDIQEVHRNTRAINDLTTNINSFVEEVRARSSDDEPGIDRVYVEEVIVPAVAGAVVQALRAEGVIQ